MNNENAINLVLCGDKNFEIGIHTTLYSLLEHSKRNFKIYLIHKDYNDKDFEKLFLTLMPFNGRYQLIPIPFEDEYIRKFKTFYGTNLTYSRIMLDRFINGDRIIFIDSDLIIKLDLGELYDLDLNNKIIGCCRGGNGGTVNGAVEKNFFISLGLEGSASFFNPCVMLIDLKKWRSEKITEKCLQFGSGHSDKLLTYDQTILNYVFHNNFYELKEKYNVELWSYDKSVGKFDISKIYHFIGYPKPWEFGAELLHNNYPLFKETLSKTVYRNFKSYTNWNYKKIKTIIWHIKPYLKNLSTRIKF
jgi:lipopolysaccharide biosynthesis glycosyltransferase